MHPQPCAPLLYGSVCSGIEAVSLAWQPLGLEAAWFAEIEPFPSAVLAHHYPRVPNLGDMTSIAHQVRAGTVPAPDILVGGTPCQSFSVAGARQAMRRRGPDTQPACAHFCPGGSSARLSPANAPRKCPKALLRSLRTPGTFSQTSVAGGRRSWRRVWSMAFASST